MKRDRRRMRAALVALASFGGTMMASPVALATGAVDAEAANHPNAAISGEFAGAGTWNFDPSCGFVREVYSGTYDPVRRAVADGTYTLDLCIPGSDEQGWIATGSFDVTTSAGLVLRGTVDGHFIAVGWDEAGTHFDVDLTLTVTESTGGRRPILGTIVLDGTRLENGNTVTHEGTFRTNLRHA